MRRITESVNVLVRSESFFMFDLHSATVAAAQILLIVSIILYAEDLCQAEIFVLRDKIVPCHLKTY